MRLRATMTAVFVILLATISQIQAFDNPGPGDILINEYVPNSSTEWVELYNTTPTPLDISGYYIDDLAAAGGSPKPIPGPYDDPCLWLLRHGIQPLFQQYG